MDKFVPRDKMSPKARRQLDSQRRTLWTVLPATRTMPDKTK